MINNLTFGFNNISQVLSIFLGLIVLVLAFYMIISGNHPGELISWSLYSWFIFCLVSISSNFWIIVLYLKIKEIKC